MEDEDYTVEDVKNQLVDSEYAIEKCVLYKIEDQLDSLYNSYVNNLIHEKELKDRNDEKEARHQEYLKLKEEFE